MKWFISSLVGLCFLMVSSIRLQAQEKDAATTAKIQKLLATRYASAPAGQRKFIYNAVDLNDDGKNEYLVGLIGAEFCGNAGCKMLVLNSSFAVTTSMTLVKYPVYAGAPGGAEVTKGYSNLYIYTGGKGYVKMAWNGKAYPSNPSSAPAVKASVVEGKFKFLNATDDITYEF